MADRFDRFSEGARRAMNGAARESQRLGLKFIGTEHFLVAVVSQEDGIAARALASLGITVDEVRSAVEVAAGSEPPPIPGEIGMTRDSKRTIELAVDEVRRGEPGEIGLEHLLIGLVREEDGTAARVLADLGVDTDRVRGAVAEVRRDEMGPGAESGETDDD